LEDWILGNEGFGSATGEFFLGCRLDLFSGKEELLVNCLAKECGPGLGLAFFLGRSVDGELEPLRLWWCIGVFERLRRWLGFRGLVVSEL